MLLVKIFYSVLFHFKKKNNNLIIVTSAWNKYYNMSTKYVFELLKERTSYDVRFIVNDDISREKLNHKIGPYFITSVKAKDIKLIFSAKMWITSAGFPIRTFFCGFKRYILKFDHGFPIKEEGLMNKSLPLLKKILVKSIYSFNYTAVSACTPFDAAFFMSRYNLPSNKIEMLGSPCFTECKNIDKAEKKLLNYYTKKKDEKLVLYAPTYRDYGATKIFPFGDFEKEELYQFLENNNIKIFLRLHHLEQHLVEELTHENILSFGIDVCTSIVDVLGAFDLVISDYSSVAIDFLITKKPAMFFLYDIEEYRKERGLVEGVEDFFVGPKPNTFSEFKEELLKLLHEPSYYNKEREDYFKYMNQVEDSSGSIINYIDSLLND